MAEEEKVFRQGCNKVGILYPLNPELRVTGGTSS